jgi:hypothetical protein
LQSHFVVAFDFSISINIANWELKKFFLFFHLIFKIIDFLWFSNGKFLGQRVLKGSNFKLMCLKIGNRRIIEKKCIFFSEAPNENLHNLIENDY